MAQEDLVSRRPRRSTAGNRCVLLGSHLRERYLTITRMELALAELALEAPQEPEEDVEFVVEKGMLSLHLYHLFIQVKSGTLPLGRGGRHL